MVLLPPPARRFATVILRFDIWRATTRMHLKIVSGLYKTVFYLPEALETF